MNNSIKIRLYWHTKLSAGSDLNDLSPVPSELVQYAYENGYSTIAVTDRYTLQAYPEVFRTWTILWNRYKDECKIQNKKAEKKDFLKIIYGLEGKLLCDDSEQKTVLIYVMNETGMTNLYKIVTDSYLKYFDKIPLIPAALLEKYKDGLFILDTPEKLSSVQNEIAERAGYISPLRNGKYYPDYPEAEEKLKLICEERVKELFEYDVPEIIANRMKKELNAVCANGYAGIYMIWHDLAALSAERGYTTAIRGCAGASLVAYLCGITGINPLPSVYGGYDIPAETFMGTDYKREPDIDINFATDIQRYIQAGVAGLPGIGETCCGGTVSVCKGKTDGFHPGGVIVCPEGEELLSFTPLQHPWDRDRISSHFDYHYLTDTLLKLDILGYTPLDLLHKMQIITGKNTNEIPLHDTKTLVFLCDPDTDMIAGLPEFGSEFVRRMIRESGAKTFDDLIKIDGLIHGSGVWWGVQRDMVLSGKISLKECISTRDDIFQLLIKKGMNRDEAYHIMESVRKGNGLTGNMQHNMILAGISDEYIDICNKTEYLFSRSQAVSYTLTAWRLAYYMIHYPSEYMKAVAATG